MKHLRKLFAVITNTKQQTDIVCFGIFKQMALQDSRFRVECTRKGQPLCKILKRTLV